MQRVCVILILTLLVSTAAAGQKRSKATPQSRARKVADRTPPASAPPRLVGSPVAIVTKNGDRITGTLVDLTAYSIRIKADNLESTISLDRIASLAFGEVPGEGPHLPSASVPVSADFARNAEPALAEFQNIARQLQQGTDYTDYGVLLTKLRRTGEQFIDRYGTSENPSEARVVAALSAALTDYTWAKTIWLLRLNRSGDTTAFDTDAPALSDALVLYPEIRASAAVGKKFSVDKVVAGLWKKAAEKTDRARTLATTNR